MKQLPNSYQSVIVVTVVVSWNDGDFLALAVHVGDAVKGVGRDALHRHALNGMESFIGGAIQR